MAVLGAMTLILAAAVVYLIQEQRQQAQELARLTACVSILERNQGAGPGDVIPGCPIYN
jgi:uncharacterized protein (DUF2141 family)